MDSSDVVIVGAGIGGAVLALALGGRGWKIKLLEREVAPRRMVRPEILWGATPTALDRYGMGEIVRSAASVRLQGVSFQQGERPLLTLSPDVLRRANVAAYSTDPNLTREAIAEAAVATGNVTVQRGVQVERVEQAGGGAIHVLARHSKDQHADDQHGDDQHGDDQLEERCRLVVGDDGAHSVVRSVVESDWGKAGSQRAAIELKMFPLDFLTAEIAWPDELPPDWVRLWLDSSAFRQGIPALGCFPWPGRRGVLLLPLPHARAERLKQASAAQFWQELTKLTALATSFAAQVKFPDDFKHVRRPYGHAARYVADGAAIVGDAAHPVSPAGGQGANAAIWDALALADVADEALAGDDVSRERLSRYEALRRPRNRDSVAITERVSLAFRCAGYLPGQRWLVPGLLRVFDAMPRVKSRAIHAIGTTFITR